MFILFLIVTHFKIISKLLHIALPTCQDKKINFRKQKWKGIREVMKENLLHYLNTFLKK